MSSSLAVFTDKSTIVVLAYAQAGLGHLRVTDALYHGLPPEVEPVLIGWQDQSIVFFHRITSNYPIARIIFEKSQSGFLESFFAYIYRRFLKSRSKFLYAEIIKLLDQKKEARKVVFIATHFALAHQFAEVKKRLEAERKIDISLIIQVTDDSPQKLWYVPEADMIFVPSEKTKEALLRYGTKKGFRIPKFEIIGYPLSKNLNEELKDEEWIRKLEQSIYASPEKIHICIPISGAAFGLGFLNKLVNSLNNQSSRFMFHIVSKKNIYTTIFLSRLEKFPFVDVHTGVMDQDVIDKYEKVYETETIGFEVTKPSEQAFKAVLEPKKRGGPLLLFLRPVGRQEYDNLLFLRKHRLIPQHDQKFYLWIFARNNKDLSKDSPLYKESIYWRGVELPPKPERAASFIIWLLKQGILSNMMAYKKPISGQNLNEISADGVDEFWKKVEEFLK